MAINPNFTSQGGTTRFSLKYMDGSGQWVEMQVNGQPVGRTDARHAGSFSRDHLALAGIQDLIVKGDLFVVPCDCVGKATPAILPLLEHSALPSSSQLMQDGR